MMRYIATEAFEKTPVAADPFPHLVVRDFVSRENLASIAADFPNLPGSGAFPPAALKLQGTFARLMEDLTAPWLRGAVEEKFGIDLSGRPLVWTMRGYVRERDGAVHTDSESKIVTLLLYLNEKWDNDGGRLRLLRSQDSLDNPVVEIPPDGGTLLCFLRGEKSWHGHLPYAGARRAVQLNFVTDDKVAAREQRRHLLSARMKQAEAFFQGGR
ncbi:MAG TPA: 2OG-Fe(II) oxygenase [Methylovirgula sp.]